MSQDELERLRAENEALRARVAELDGTPHGPSEPTLRETNETLKVALEATGVGLWMWDLRTDQVTWDDNMRALHGLDQAPPPNRYRELLVHPDDRAVKATSATDTRQAGVLEQLTYRIVRPDGAIRWVFTVSRTVRDEQGRPIKLLGGSLDVTHTRELEDQLRQSQKMEAIGSLTAGIAHNFNNMLAVILPTLEGLTETVTPQKRDALSQASHAARRAAELVRELMTYAGQGASQALIPRNLDGIVNAAVRICRPSFDPHIELRIESHLAQPNVRCSAVQLEQILVNLLLNARDSILESGADRGRVTVRVHPATVSAAEGSVERKAVRVEVIDDGQGMSEGVRSRVFEPFFTTKRAGKGTGLGLATSHAIARDHHGTLTCSSSPGHGATFALTLPLSEQSEPPSEPPHAPPRLAGVLRGVRVLLVDDDIAVRNTLQHVLSMAGLIVAEAESGESALRVLRSDPAIQVILLDRSMPGGSGETFVPEMRKLCPAARIAFLSGRGSNPELATLVDSVILKPLRATDLLAAIRDMLSGTA